LRSSHTTLFGGVVGMIVGKAAKGSTITSP
jgi:hypothetical protein